MMSSNNLFDARKLSELIEYLHEFIYRLFSLNERLTYFKKDVGMNCANKILTGS